MNLITYKEYAAKCRITTGNLSNYVKRGKVVVSESGLIDIDFAKNSEFIRVRNKKAAKKAAKKAPVHAAVVDSQTKASKKTATKQPKATPKAAAKPIKSAPSAPKEPVKPQKKVVHVSKEAQDAYKIELEKERLELEKLREANRYAKIKADKAEGLVIPVDPVKVMVATHLKNLDIEYRDILENLLGELAPEFKISPQRVVKIRESIIKSLNKAKEKAAARTKKDLGNIVKEYSDARGAGERD